MFLAVVVFSTSLGVTAVALPLRAIEAGYSPAAVGFFGAAGAALQIVTRSVLAYVLRRVADRWLMRFACACTAVAALILVVDTSLAAFLLSSLGLGLGRALFWTGSQVYLLRGDLAVGQRRLAHMSTFASTGEFIGPLLGGFVAEWSVGYSLLLCVALMAVAVAALWVLERHPPLNKVDKRHVAPVWRQPDVAVGCAAVITAGGWRGLLSSVIPAVLAELGRSAGQVGLLVAVGNGTFIGGALTAGRLAPRLFAAVAYGGILVAGLGVAAAGLAAESVVLSGTMLAVSGMGAGLLQTLGTVLAASAVHEDQRGDVVVLTGLMRSVALLAFPAGVAGLVGAMAAPLALALGGGMLILPVAAAGWRLRR